MCRCWSPREKANRTATQNCPKTAADRASNQWRKEEFHAGRLRTAARAAKDQWQDWSRQHDPNPVVETGTNRVGSRHNQKHGKQGWHVSHRPHQKQWPPLMRRAKVAPNNVRPGKVAGMATRNHRFEMDSPERAIHHTFQKATGRCVDGSHAGFDRLPGQTACLQINTRQLQVVQEHLPSLGLFVPLWPAADANECPSLRRRLDPATAAFLERWKHLHR